MSCLRHLGLRGFCKRFELRRKFESTGRKRRGKIKGLQAETCNPLILRVWVGVKPTWEVCVLIWRAR